MVVHRDRSLVFLHRRERIVFAECQPLLDIEMIKFAVAPRAHLIRTRLTGDRIILRQPGFWGGFHDSARSTQKDRQLYAGIR